MQAHRASFDEAAGHLCRRVRHIACKRILVSYGNGCSFCPEEEKAGQIDVEKDIRPPTIHLVPICISKACNKEYEDFGRTHFWLFDPKWLQLSELYL